MKHNFNLPIFLSAVLLLIASCKKEISTTETATVTKAAGQEHGHLKQTKTYSAETAIKWMNMQLRLMSATTGVANVAFSRPYAYCGVALYEAVVGGMPAYQSIAPQLNGLTGLPETGPGLGYNWAVAANTALAYMNRQFFPNATTINKAAIDSLELALNNEFAASTDEGILTRSISFGKAVAQQVFEWSKTDGYLHASDPYTAPQGPGLWVPPSNPVPASSTPFWGDLRLMVSGNNEHAAVPAPTAYSTDPSSDFYKMVKQVYDASQSLTADQTAMALYWRDVPGLTTPGHYVSILKQVLEYKNTTLDRAALAYALSGISVFDASIQCWKAKYQYNLVRPITYIRTVLGHPSWTPLLATPAHPEYPSAHATLSGAAALAFGEIFGDQYAYTDHSYDYLGMASRTYTSFNAFAEEAGASRLYAGIHYQLSIDVGLALGRTVALDVSRKLSFTKGGMQ